MNNYTNTVVPLDNNECARWPIEYQELQSSVKQHVYMTLCLADLFAVMTRAFQREGIPTDKAMTTQQIDQPYRNVRVFKKLAPQFVSVAELNGDIIESFMQHPAIEIELSNFKFVFDSLTWWSGIYWFLAGYADEQQSGYDGGMFVCYGPERYRMYMGSLPRRF